MSNALYLAQLLQSYLEDINDDIKRSEIPEGYNVLSKGSNVYLETDSTIQGVYGIVKLSELIIHDGYWNITFHKRSHCTLKFYFSDKGPDHAWFELMNNKGKVFYKSPNVSSSESYSDVIDSAKKLYKKYVTHKLYKMQK